MSKNVVIIGAGGHAKVIADIVIKSGDNLIGFLDDNIELDTIIIEGFKILGKVDDCKKISEMNPDTYFIIAIGNNQTRKKIAETYKDINYYIAIHPSSQIAIDVNIKVGTTIMANTCINASAQIGKHCIINTASIVEHDNQISDYVHLSPNVTSCGTVTIGEMTSVGAGTTIKNNINITSECIIGAGAVVVKDIEEKGTYVGVPARKIK